MAIVKEYHSPLGFTARIHDDELPKTPEELKRRQRHMYEVCAEILRNSVRREAAAQSTKEAAP